jgi:hypothetical protein
MLFTYVCVFFSCPQGGTENRERQMEISVAINYTSTRLQVSPAELSNNSSAAFIALASETQQMVRVSLGWSCVFDPL